jgi:hypothetical protein
VKTWTRNFKTGATISAENVGNFCPTLAKSAGKAILAVAPSSSSQYVPNANGAFATSDAGEVAHIPTRSALVTKIPTRFMCY